MTSSAPIVALSRRRFLTGTAIVGASLGLGATLARSLELTGEMPWKPGVADPPPAPAEARFFTPAERAAVDAITSRIVPSDDGPGAREAGVVTFIDSQLAGFYGEGRRWYMRGPYPEPLDTQGYQGPHAPAQLWRQGLAALDAYCRANHGGRVFAELDAEAQDAVLTRLDEGEVEFEGLSAERFFDFAREMTVEGFFCDPIHGGNRDMVGWRYVGFPGARYDYRPFLHHNGARLDIRPVSLMGGPHWRRPERGR